MMAKLQGWVAAILLVACIWTPTVIAQTRNVDVGGRQIAIPVEKGYTLVSDDKAAMDLITSFLPPAMEVLAFSMHQEDVASDLLVNEQYPYYFYATIDKLRSIDMDETSWKTVRPMAETQLRELDIGAASRDMMEQGNAKLTQFVGDKVEVSAKLAYKQQVWTATDGSLRMTAVMPGRMEIAGKSANFVQDAGMAMLPVRERLLVIYVYRKRDPQDQGSDAIRALLDAATRSMLKVNPPIGPSAN